MKKFKRIITIVLDSVGVGELPDAHLYQDEKSDTLGNIAKAVDGLNLPNLQSLGIGNLHEISGVDKVEKPKAYMQKLAEASLGKDTMTGHWEMMGLFIDEPFITFTETGFPIELIKELEAATNTKVIGNKSASGTEIIEELGQRHMETGELIVYTSADSVLQIAANEDTFGLDRLYEACEIARKITMKPQWKVGRVIARPFILDSDGKFKRTANRHDYALKPFSKTTLDALKENNYDVISIGKIVDIFDNEGITKSIKTTSNHDGTLKIIEALDLDFTGLLFANLVDFDALWGHRRNPVGYAQELEAFDQLLPKIINKCNHDDLLIITSDHGNDPTHHGTDHTREYIFALYYSPSFKAETKILETAKTFANIAATIADNFDVEPPKYGESELSKLI